MNGLGRLTLVVVLTAGLVALLVRPALRWPVRHPVPIGPDGPPPHYPDLGTPAFVAGCSLLTGAAAAISWLTVPAPARPLWLVLAGFGVVLVAIDARTTWLPLPLTRLAWAAAVPAAALAVPLGDAGYLIRAVSGAALAGGLYLLIWRLSRGEIGFGDVRLAPLIGGAAAAGSWRLFVLALLLGSVVGALQGVGRLVTRRPGPFPYAPAMLTGAYAACIADAGLTQFLSST